MVGQPNYERLPEHMRGGMRRYLEDKIEPGHFLMAVLENNLKEAVGHADEINRDRLPDYVMFLYNEVSSAAWGSPEKVEAYLNG